MLSLNSLQINLNGTELLKNLSISFLPSTIIYIKGPNGAGKTSLMRVLAGIMAPTKGNITFSKKNIPIADLKKPYCNYIGHNIGIKQELTVFENIKFWSEVYGSRELLDASIYYFKLYELLDKKCYELSAGNKKKVALSRLLACQSKLWLLDEVDSNLDQETKDSLHNLIITKANNGGIIFISTHNQAEIKSAQVIDIKEY